MSEIDIASVSNLENIAKSINTNFSKKQVWLKELEHAREISSYNKDGESVRDKNTYLDDNQNMAAGNIKENTAESNAESVTANQIEVGIRGEDTTAPLTVKIDTVFHNIYKPQQSDINAMARPVSSTRPASIITNRAINIQQLEASLKTEFKLQNMKLVPEGNGVRVLFRDYRLGSNTIDKIVTQLEQELKALGIPVLGIVVNGIQFSENRYII